MNNTATQGPMAGEQNLDWQYVTQALQAKLKEALWPIEKGNRVIIRGGCVQHTRTTQYDSSNRLTKYLRSSSELMI